MPLPSTVLREKRLVAVTVSNAMWVITLPMVLSAFVATEIQAAIKPEPNASPVQKVQRNREIAVFNVIRADTRIKQARTFAGSVPLVHTAIPVVHTVVHPVPKESLLLSTEAGLVQPVLLDTTL
jgi:hypothetical protein